MYSKSRVGVLLGGTSAEREVSLTTGNAILEALLSKGVDAVAIDTAGDWRAAILKEKVQVAFIALHGRGGEDGTIQGALEMMEIPYTGSGVMASAIAMDKIQTKRILMACGLDTPPFVALGPGQYDEDIPFALPVVVKPSREGSTIGITVVRDQSELAGAIETAVRRDPYILVETFVDGDDYTVGVLNNEPLAVIQIVTKTGFYDYHTKYVTGAEDYRVPAPISDEATGRLRTGALDAYLAVRCAGAARVDFRGDGEGFSVIEINTIPGMTATSLLPMSANAMGFDFSSLAMEMLKSAGEGSR